MDFFLVLVFAFFVLILVIILLARKEVAKMESPPSPPNPADLRDIGPLLAPFMRPSILLQKIEADEPSTSYFGGTLPQYPGFTWPQHEGRALGFLACIDLAALPRTFDWLPRTGHLLFFYDIEESPYGDAADVGGWVLLHTDHPIDASTPKATETANLSNESTVVHKGMSFRVAKLPPHYDEEVIAHLQLTSAESDDLIELRQSMIETPNQIGGYPDPIQNHDMPIECETAMLLLSTPNTEKLSPPDPVRVKQWQLLFQVASDDDLGVMWGDAGMLYFYIREDDARRSDFSNVWLIMQCC